VTPQAYIASGQGVKSFPEGNVKTMLRNTIYTSFNDPDLAERAAGALLDHGVSPDDISLIQSTKKISPSAEDVMPHQVPPPIYVVPNIGGMTTGLSPQGIAPMIAIDADDETVQYAHDPIRQLEDEAKHGISTTTPEDAEVGALKGGAWGAGLGAAAILATMFVPGIGVVLGGGALASAIGAFLASAGAGAVVGGVTGYLKDQGVESKVAEIYNNAVIAGGAVLALTLPSGEVDEAAAWTILDKYAAQNVTSYSGRPYLG